MTQMKVVKWTQEEIDIIKENYEFGNIHNLEKLLPNRTYNAITTKARKLGIKSRTFWSEDEINILNENYHIKTVDEIVKMLPNRTRESIIVQAGKLGLVSVCKYNEAETQFIIENWETMTDKEMGKTLNRPYRGVIARRLLLGLLRGKEESSYNDLSEYIRRNNLDWKTQSMINCNYKCFLTGNRFDDIHHIYGLNLILNETLIELNIKIKPCIDEYAKKELRDILDLFRIKQAKYPLGVCLSKDVHMLFHNKYGYGNNNQEQWDEFVKDFKNGKYNEFINV